MRDFRADLKGLIFSVSALLVLSCASATPAEIVGGGKTVIQSGVDLPVPRQMLGTWILTDTGQCANQADKVVVTPATVQFGERRSDRMRFVPKSGAYGGDALHFWIAAKEEILEYDSQSDRIIWESRGADYFTVEYYERCTW